MFILEEGGVEGRERPPDLRFAICEIRLAVASVIRDCEGALKPEFL